MMVDTACLDGAIAAFLRGDPVNWGKVMPCDGADGSTQDAGANDNRARAIATIADRIDYHGIAGLLYQRSADLADWPTALMQRVREDALSQAFWEQSHRAVLMKLIDALEAAGTATLLLKGTALAYTIYADPAQRRRGDTDLLVDHADLATVQDVLRHHGFTCVAGYLYQQDWQITGADGFTHALDLHWQVINSPRLHAVLNVRECMDRGTPAPRLHPAARAADCAALFLHGCYNQAWHAQLGYHASGGLITGGNRVLWAYDNHLLLQHFTPQDQAMLVRAARVPGVGQMCLDGIALAQRHFQTPVAADLLDALRQAARAAPGQIIHSAAGSWAEVRDDLRAVGNLQDGARYLLIHVFPPASHMHLKYPDAIGWPLPLLYLRRIAGGLGRLLKRLAKGAGG